MYMVIRQLLKKQIKKKTKKDEMKKKKKLSYLGWPSEQRHTNKHI